MAVNTTKFPARGASAHSAASRKAASRGGRHPSDDEILGLVTAVPRPEGDFDDSIASSISPDLSAASQGRSPAPAQSSSVGGPESNGRPYSDQAQPANASSAEEGNSAAAESSAAAPASVSADLAPILEANPQLRQAWDAAQEYQQIFATPAAARDAQQQLGELDGLFFSSQPADHASLAARIHELSPEAFHGLAQAMQAHAAKVAGEGKSGPANAAAGSATAPSSPTASDSRADQPPQGTGSQPVQHASAPEAGDPRSAAGPDTGNAAKAAFFHGTNAAAVEQILGAIHTQVDHLLPESVAAPTRTRIVGEIYRELDAALRANSHLGKQLRESFQAGPHDASHQRAIVTLVTGRARQALPAVAKRVIGEWTQSILAANRERLGRHEAASKRVDISGAGPSDGVNRKPISPRDVNYRKLSDADILNL